VALLERLEVKKRLRRSLRGQPDKHTDKKPTETEPS
jgi:hypothetical protein